MKKDRERDKSYKDIFVNILSHVFSFTHFMCWYILLFAAFLRQPHTLDCRELATRKQNLEGTLSTSWGTLHLKK